MKRFVRADTVRLKRLGKNRQKLQKWRKPKGRHSKMRKKRAGYPISPSIGHGTPRGSRGLIEGRMPLVVYSLNQLESAGKNQVIVISRTMGARKRIELIKRASALGLPILNVREQKK